MKFLFVGQNLFGGSCLRVLIDHGMNPSLVITRPSSDYANLAELVAEQHGIELARATAILKDGDLLRRMQTLQPDVILCCGWGHRIREPLLSLPTLGWVNLHPSYLPAYRGPSPIEWQIMCGEEYAGGTAHFMSDKFDEGNIVIQERVKIDEADTGGTLGKKCGSVLGHLAVRTIERLSIDPHYRGVKQDPSKASYFPYRPDAMQIDWSRSASEVRDLVRALAPFPCAVLSLGEYDMRVAEVVITPRATSEHSAGQISLSDSGKIEVAAKDFVLRITAARIDTEITREYLPLLPDQAQALIGSSS